jgi:hypothetical protein
MRERPGFDALFLPSARSRGGQSNDTATESIHRHGDCGYRHAAGIFTDPGRYCRAELMPFTLPFL